MTLPKTLNGYILNEKNEYTGQVVLIEPQQLISPICEGCNEHTFAVCKYIYNKCVDTICINKNNCYGGIYRYRYDYFMKENINCNKCGSIMILYN